MSMPSWLREELHRQEEEVEAKLPYDPSVATQVELTKKVVEQKQKAVVWDKNPWDRFDRKVVLAFTGNRERIDMLRGEFARVGLTDVETHWNCPDHFLKYLSVVPCARFDSTNLAILNNALGHYRILKSSYELGCDSCLVMEDDIRFLRDVNTLRSILDSIPADYEVAMLDSHPTFAECSAGTLQGDTGTDFWHRVKLRYSAGCYAASRKGMEKLIALYEKEPLHASDNMFSSKFFSNIYYCSPLAARQVRTNEKGTNTNYDSWSQKYDALGAMRGKYGK